MNPTHLNVEARENFGKSATKQIRVKGKIPAVLYGREMEPIHFALDPKDLKKALATPYRRNTLLEMELGGEKHYAVVQNVEIDPLSENVMHVDFYAIKEGQVVEFEVPIETQGTSKGVKLGGILDQVRRVLKVKCKIADLPVAIVVDISKMDVNDKCSIGDLDLIENVHFIDDDSTVLVQVKSARGVEEEAEEEGEEGEGEGEGDDKPAAEGSEEKKDSES